MKKALIVIDMQNDYLWENRKKMFAYDTEKLCSGVNELIHRFTEEGNDVIYIRHLIQNLLTNRLLFGYSLKGTKGAEIYDGVDIISDYIFDKYVGDALTNRKLRKFIKKNGYETLCLCGLDEYGCVAATALGAKKRGISSELMQSGTATVFPPRKIAKVRRKLKNAGLC